MNPIMQMLNQQGPRQNGIFDLINQIRKADNPQSMFNSLMSTNPQIQSVMSYVNQNGGDAKQAFYALAQQRGVDPQSILSQLS